MAVVLAFASTSAQAAVSVQNTGGTSGDFVQSGLAANFSRDGTKIGAPMVPEPSPKTSLYVLGGVVGLGFVVMRRRRKVA